MAITHLAIGKRKMKEIIAVSAQGPCCQLSLMGNVCSLFRSWWLSPRQAEAALAAQGWIRIISHSYLVDSVTEDCLQLPEQTFNATPKPREIQGIHMGVTQPLQEPTPQHHKPWAQERG